MQFHQNYSKDITEALAPNFSVDGAGNLIGIDIPLKIPEDKRNELLPYNNYILLKLLCVHECI